jgi:hypothetical protein
MPYCFVLTIRYYIYNCCTEAIEPRDEAIAGKQPVVRQGKYSRLRRIRGGDERMEGSGSCFNEKAARAEAQAAQ